MSKAFAEAFPFRILVAEDNVINRQLILHILGNLGYEPACVENGKEAVESVGRAGYDLILMDVQMPEMDGLEATEIIRRQRYRQPVIIALTANAMQGDREQCLTAGMDDYICKPVRLDELMELLEKWGTVKRKAV
jgi:CheY-like chemotaxis protein